jgi:putative aldouronate transport system permease protein
MGWSAIIYIASLAGVSPELHEAAIMDGATKFKRIIHIDIPTILPTIVILLILNTGSLMSVGFEKAFLMQNNLNLEVSEVIATYVYKIGLLNAQHSFATAVGLFNSVVNLILLLLVNQVAKRLSGSGLF